MSPASERGDFVGSMRQLLSQGNDKMGSSIHSWSIPAVRTCPGSSPTCRGVCYATHGRFVTDKVKALMRWRLEQSRQADFSGRMVEEIFRRGVLVCRVHVAGDFYSPDYVTKWIEVAARSPKTRFFAYTRSWRVERIEPVLRAFAGLDNVRLWYSADRDTGYPPSVPEGVRVAWLQVSETETCEPADLAFQVRRLRRLALPMAVPVCPQELPEGKERGVCCANCQICFE
jgi:hypothetical protein